MSCSLPIRPLNPFRTRTARALGDVLSSVTWTQPGQIADEQDLATKNAKLLQAKREFRSDEQDVDDDEQR